ncbi:MAG: AraC family transcriptional regulator N-terminal domain-containing protein [Thermomicrobiales bacterium]
MRLRRASNPSMGHGVFLSSFCLVAQGSKEIHLAIGAFYDTTRYLVSTAMLPISSRVIGQPDRPFRGCHSARPLDGSVMVSRKPAPRSSELSAIDVSACSMRGSSGAVRLSPAHRHTDDARFLARDSSARLSTGSSSANRERMRQTTLAAETNHISEAIARLRADFNKPIGCVPSLAPRNLDMAFPGSTITKQ